MERGRCMLLQFAECTSSLDLPLVENDDSVYKVQKRAAERVGDDEDGSSHSEIFEYRVNDVFTLRVDSRGGLIKNQNAGISDDCSSECDALSLAPGKFATFFTDDCLIAIGQLLDESGSLCFFGSLVNQLGSRSGIPIADVFVDSVVEQECFLGYESDLASEISSPKFADIDAVNEYLTFVGIHKSGEQAEQC